MECGSNKSTEAWLIARMRREFYNGTFLQCLTRQHRCHWGSSSHRRQTEPDVGPLSYQENAELQLKHNLMVKSHVLEHRWFSTQACSLFSEGVYPGTRQSITSAAVKSGLPGLVLLFCRTRCQTTTNMNAPALPAVPPVRAEPPRAPLSENHVTSALRPQAFKEQNKLQVHVKKGPTGWRQMDVTRCLFPSTRLCGGVYFYYCAQTLSSFFLSSWMEKKIGWNLTDVLWYPLLPRKWLFKTLKRGRSHHEFRLSCSLVSLHFVLHS